MRYNISVRSTRFVVCKMFFQRGLFYPVVCYNIDRYQIWTIRKDIMSRDYASSFGYLETRLGSVIF